MSNARIDRPVIRRRLDVAVLANRLRRGSPAEALAARQGFVVTPAQLRAAGVDRAEQRSRIRRKVWTATRYGAVSVLPPQHETLSGSDPEVVAAATALVSADLTVGADSAAAMHGLPLLTPVRRPALVATRRQLACDWPEIVIRVAALPPEDRSTWFGTPVTTIARTVCDLARHSARAGIVAAEAALHEGLLARVELDEVITRQRGWPGVRTARMVVALADCWSESPLESLTRLFLRESGIVQPDQQKLVATDAGVFRVDGLWAARAVVLEVDGMLKYRLPASGDEDNPLGAEKLRQEAIERAGYRVVRVTWADIHARPEQTVRRILDALRRGGPRASRSHSRFQGQLPTSDPKMWATHPGSGLLVSGSW